jgi:WbqC-like protein family
MFLPWIGFFEQVKAADIFVHYDDVQLPQGRSFVSRVQIKSPVKITWLTAPIDRTKSEKMINQSVFSEHEDWRRRHLSTLRHTYAGSPECKLMFELAERLYDNSSTLVSEFNINAIEIIAAWLGLNPKFERSSQMAVAGSSSQRLVDLCLKTGCDTYITGHGALNYLNHQIFEEQGISVRYMDYRKVPYRQSNDEFTPFVSVLDAIANCGSGVRELVCSDSVYWKDLLRPADAVSP